MMGKSLMAAVALAAMAAALTAVAAGGTHSAGEKHSVAQRVRIDVKGTDAFAFELTPRSKGRSQPDTGPVTFCCWRSWTVKRAGATLQVTNPLLTLVGARGTLKVRNQIEWVGLPDDWSVWNGTWKVVGGTGAYAGLSGHGRDGGAWGRRDASNAQSPVDLRIRFYGYLTRG
jgi:hypothetical protein